MTPPASRRQPAGMCGASMTDRLRSRIAPVEGAAQDHDVTRILLVEDHEDLRDALSRRLERRGFHVVLAPDGETGLRRALMEQPDVILLDMNLPLRDGWSVARSLRGAEGEAARIPIIALTAHGLSASPADLAAAGFDAYHPKPVDFPRLLEQIDEALLGRDEP